MSSSLVSSAPASVGLDSKFTRASDAVLVAEDIRMLKSAPRAKAVCERLVGTLRRELLDRLLIVNGRHRQSVLVAYAGHFNGHRPHQSREQPARDIKSPPVRSPADDGPRSLVRQRWTSQDGFF